MPELRPAGLGGKMPNPDRKLSDGFSDPRGTYRGDLINTRDPRSSAVHPNDSNDLHRDYPHYNITLPNGDRSAIIIIPKAGKK